MTEHFCSAPSSDVSGLAISERAASCAVEFWLPRPRDFAFLALSGAGPTFDTGREAGDVEDKVVTVENAKSCSFRRLLESEKALDRLFDS